MSNKWADHCSWKVKTGYGKAAVELMPVCDWLAEGLIVDGDTELLANDDRSIAYLNLIGVA